MLEDEPLAIVEDLDVREDGVFGFASIDRLGNRGGVSLGSCR